MGLILNVLEQKKNIQIYAQIVRTRQNATLMINFGVDREHYNV
jgi:hypothetical protein